MTMLSSFAFAVMARRGPSDPRRPAPKHGPGGPGRRLSINRRLLLADDDDAIRETIADLLEIEGWAIVEARNGVEALERAGAEPFDVVILDERMPGLRGSDVYRALREKGVHVPVVLITAANGIDRLAASLGVPAFLAKPFKVDDLLDALDRVIPREE